MKKFTLTENAKLQCSCGNSLSELKVTSQTFSKIEGRLEATENDNASGENIFSFGTCSQTKKSCIPEPLQWIGVESWDMIGEGGGLTNHSTLACSLGGTISCKENTQYFHYIGEGDSKPNEDYLTKWEEMANRRRRGDAYVLLKDGTLRKDEDMLEGTVDRIYAVKEDGTGDFLNRIDLEEMGQIGDTWEETSGGYCSFTMKTKDMAKKVFEFLAVNSDVEFSYAQLDKLFFIGTSKLKTKIIGGRTVVNNKLRGAKEVEFIHSHPYNHSLGNEEIRNMPDAPSGFNTKSGLPNDDGGDRNNAESILKINPKAKFFVFSCLYSKKDRTSVYIQYNDKKFDYTRTKKYYDSKGSPTYYEYEM